jgi:hypothetical protein
VVVHAAPLDEVAETQTVSDRVVDVAGWVVASRDNEGLPFAIVDKTSAQVLVFGPKGELKGMAPALIGSAVGDSSHAYVGEVRELSEIAPEDRTTPAGRFLARYGPAAGGKTVLWVDPITAVSLHPLAETDRSERRHERLASPEPDDNRITFGCINVSPAFYKKVVRPAFKNRGVVYVLPEEMSLESAIPRYMDARALAAAKAEKKVGKARRSKVKASR